MTSAKLFYWIEYIGGIFAYWFIYFLVLIFLQIMGWYVIWPTVTLVWITFLVVSFFMTPRLVKWAKKRMAARLLLEIHLLNEDENDNSI